MPNFEDQTVRFAPGSSPYKPANNPSGTKLLIFDGDKAPAEYDLRSFGKTEITFGRNLENDIVLTSKIASRQHGYFQLHNGRVFVYDNNSTNGLILNSKYVQSAAFGAGDVLRIDDPKNNIQNNILMMLNTEEASSWKSMRLDRDVFTIGRAAGNSLQLGHISVSSRHARIVRNQGRFILYDENSTNGTYVNGIKVTGARPLSEKDVIIITNTKLIFSNGYLFYCTYTQGIGIHVSNIVKQVKQKRKSKVICNGVTLDIRPAELVAIIGGSGAGKTTLMNAICGYNKPTSG
jgi:pSer/pThr/pTyr-binding forkhead associated (FHA) protein